MIGRTIEIDTPRAFKPLLAPKQYKGARGGRGGGKSRFFADRVVEEMLSQHTRIACVREVQNSIKDSVKQLIEDAIVRFNVGHMFKTTEREIVGPHDSLAIFRGLQNHTATSIKSLARFNRAWYEEAQSLSQKSLDLAVNTFREDDGIDHVEQWFSWNPDEPDDPVDVFFRENENDPHFVCVTVNYPDNPWFPENLKSNVERDRLRDPDKYNHIWLGGYRMNSEAQVFRNWKVERFDPPPPGTPIYFGADWGMTIDPTVLVACFVVGHTLYIWREVWALDCGLDRRGALFDRIDPEWTFVKARDPNWQSIARRSLITADSAEPQTIKYLKENGFPRIRAAVKGPNSVEEGVTFLQQYDIVVHPDCKSPDGISHVADELRNYSYKVDKKTDAILPELGDKKNHMIDSLRYALENVRRAITTERRELHI